MRATLSHVEAALEAREAELHDSWHALRLQAADLQSDSELTPEMLQPDASVRVRTLLLCFEPCFCLVSTAAAAYSQPCKISNVGSSASTSFTMTGSQYCWL